MAPIPGCALPFGFLVRLLHFYIYTHLHLVALEKLSPIFSPAISSSGNAKNMDYTLISPTTTKLQLYPNYI